MSIYTTVLRELCVKRMWYRHQLSCKLQMSPMAPGEKQTDLLYNEECFSATGAVVSLLASLSSLFSWLPQMCSQPTDSLWLVDVVSNFYFWLASIVFWEKITVHPVTARRKYMMFVNKQAINCNSVVSQNNRLYWINISHITVDACCWSWKWFDLF